MLIWSLPVMHSTPGLAAATGNALSRSPSVIRRVGGTRSVDVEPQQRRRHESTSDVSWSVSARYCGALPWRQWWTGTDERNCIRSGTFSRWTSRRSGVVCVCRTPGREHQPNGGVEDCLQSSLQRVAHAQCDAWPTVAFLVAERHHPLTGTKLYCLVTGAQKGEQNAHSRYSAEHRPGVEPLDLLIASRTVQPIRY